MKNIVLKCLFVAVITGCSGDSVTKTGTPYYYNSEFFLAGDNSCRYLTQISEDKYRSKRSDAKVRCYDEAKDKTVVRNALTYEQLYEIEKNGSDRLRRDIQNQKLRGFRE